MNDLRQVAAVALAIATAAVAGVAHAGDPPPRALPVVEPEVLREAASRGRLAGAGLVLIVGGSMNLLGYPLFSIIVDESRVVLGIGIALAVTELTTGACLYGLNRRQSAASRSRTLELPPRADEMLTDAIYDAGFYEGMGAVLVAYSVVTFAAGITLTTVDLKFVGVLVPAVFELTFGIAYLVTGRVRRHRIISDALGVPTALSRPDDARRLELRPSFGLGPDASGRAAFTTGLSGSF